MCCTSNACPDVQSWVLDCNQYVCSPVDGRSVFDFTGYVFTTWRGTSDLGLCGEYSRCGFTSVLQNKAVLETLVLACTVLKYVAQLYEQVVCTKSLVFPHVAFGCAPDA